MSKAPLRALAAPGLVAALLFIAGVPAFSQGQVKVVGIVLSVKHRVGPAGSLVTSKVGALLPPGSRVQTGARSKCALQFPNGGVIRMGERSDLIIQSPANTTLKLSQGQLWAKVIAGTTARVEGSHGVAVVKGTEWAFDGRTIVCFGGDVSYETNGGTTDVPAGYEGTAAADGTVSRRPAPGRTYPGGDLIQWFGGIREGREVNVTSGESPGIARKHRDIAIDRIVCEAVTPRSGNLNVIVQGTTDLLSAAARARAAGMDGTTGPNAAWGQFPGLDPNTLAPLSLARPSGWTAPLSAGAHSQVPQLPDRRYFFGPYTLADAFAYLGDGGGTAGLRVRPHAVWGPLYAEVGATTRVSDWYGDGTDITEAFATWREDWGDVTFGRQRFLKGPVNNSRLGSLLGFDTGDALRVETGVGDLGIDVAYVRKMSPIIGTPARGWYSRFEYPLLGGLAGLNVVSDEAPDDVGFSIDLGVPAIDGELDLYGEFGTDAYDRDLYTVGAYFPGLFQRENVDLFVEYADRDLMPSLATVRAYKHFGEDLTAVFSIDKASGESLAFGAGAIWRFGD